MFHMSLCRIYSQMCILLSSGDFTWRRSRETQRKTRSCTCVVFHTSHEDVHSHSCVVAMCSRALQCVSGFSAGELGAG